MVDVANWGTGNGILIRSGGNMGLYFDEIFSNAEFCVLTSLSMFAVGAYVFEMDKIYFEQKKAVNIMLKLQLTKCWKNSTASQSG